MKTALKVSAIVLLIAGCSAGTFFATRHYAFAAAYSKNTKAAYQQGYNKGHTEGYVKATQDDSNLQGCGIACPKSQPAAKTTSPAPVYIAPQHCTSSTYGSEDQFTNTDCY